MLSILIPVFNFNVTELVTEIHSQAIAAGIKFEILCFDDGSEEIYKKQNEQVGQFQYVRYVELKKNIGRSAIRNTLAQAASYEYLLFMECDSKIISSRFIRNYIAHCKNNTVVCGGRCYEKNPPFEKEKFFRWYYGTQRENMPALKRQKSPYRLLFSNNIMLPATVFFSVRFNESITGYGYEDSAWGFELKQKKINVIHIDNPLCHIGLDDTSVYLAKTENALKNLAYLISENRIGKEVKLFKYFKIVNFFPATFVFSLLFWLMKPLCIRNIHSSHPVLFFWDVYKLGILLSFKL